MENRIAAVSILVSDPDSVESLNRILHTYGEYIVGRMGIPYRQRSINIICIAIDAPTDVINSLTGKIGRLPGVTAKAAYSVQTFESKEKKNEKHYKKAFSAAPHPCNDLRACRLRSDSVYYGRQRSFCICC